MIPSRAIRRQWPGSLVLLAALAAPVGARADARQAVGHIQPALAHLAAQQPNRTVHVIVQETVGAAQMTHDLSRLGGHMTKNLSIIHAVAATLPARALPTLAATPGVRWISLDAAVVKSSYTCCSAADLQQVYPQVIGASSVWGQYQGQGIGVAVVDSGVMSTGDTQNRIVARVKFNSSTNNMSDKYGHGTHVAGIIAGDGTSSNGAYTGIAPQANLISVKVSDDNGGAAVSDVVNGLQWVYTNAATYNIRVVNLSLNSTVADSYQVDPLDAAVETLWNAGIVVVASAGNNGSTNAGALFAPANDPFVITVGAVNDQGTASTADDAVASFSAFGTVPVSTTVGPDSVVTKPDLVAPGVNIVSDLASSSDTLAVAHPDHVVTYNGCTCYFRMSGTSMAAPMVAGAAALLLQAHPTLTPNQVKYRLTATASPLGLPGSGAGEVNVVGAIQSASTASANQNLALAAALQPGNPAASWGSASWGSASWGSASWGSASWGSASWGSASWGSASWGSASWGSDYWGR